MPQESELPEALEHARRAEGVAFELRRDPMGVLELPGLENVLIGIHVGAPAKLALPARRQAVQRDGGAW